jgi:ABC-type multidrug transport system fused ATPase/permease subunit
MTWRNIYVKIVAMSSKDFQLIRRALKYINPYKIRFFVTFLCILLGIGFSLIQPLILGKLLTSLFEKNFNSVISCVKYVVILFIFQAVVGAFQNYLFSFLTENINYDFKRDMYKKILDLPVKAFDEMRTGEFISRLHGDTSAVANILTNRLLSIIVDVLKVVFIGIAVFSISVPLALIVIAVFPLSYLVFSKYGKKIRTENNKLAKLNDKYFSNISEALFGIREVKSLGVKKIKYEAFLSLAGIIRSKSININVLNNISQTFVQGINFLSQAAIMAAGGYFIYTGALTMQLYIAFTSYSNQFSYSLMNITSFNSNIQQILTSLERIFGLMDNLSYPIENYGDVKIKNIEGNIKFENVFFMYDENSPVLNGISFKIKKNKKIAIVGTSGSGKTTMFNLLLRFYNPTEGKIFIDGTDIRDIDEDSLRSYISIVHQDPFLFNMSVRDNLLLANLGADEDEIVEACKNACIHEFIMNMPEKYDSIIGENGINLSNGQKQRIAIARALLKESKIILFDEATASLDNESQYYIKEAINRISQKHTVIIIAHRLSTIIEADEIMVVEDGRIAGQGTHGMLIHKNSIYQRLYETELNVLKFKTEEVI